MSRFILAAANFATGATPIVAQAPNNTSSSTVLKAYVPQAPLSFGDPKQIIGDVFNSSNDSGLITAWRTVGSGLNYSQPDISAILAVAPFSDITSIYVKIVNDKLGELKTTLDSFQDGAKYDDYADAFANFSAGIDTAFKAYSQAPDVSRDSYAIALGTSDLTNFVQKLQNASIPLAETDATTLVFKMATQLLDEVNAGLANHDVDSFHSALKVAYPTDESFKKAILKKIVDSGIEQNEIKSSIQDSIDDEKQNKSDIISQYGLNLMLDNFKIAIDVDYSSSIDALVNNLLSELESATSSADYDTAITNYTKALNSLVNTAKNDIDAKFTKAIMDVEKDWSAILANLYNNIYFWDVFEADLLQKGEERKPYESFEKLIDPSKINTLDDFMKKYSNAAGDEPLYFDTISKWTFEEGPSYQDGERTRGTAQVALSTKIRDLIAQKPDAIPDYANKKDTIYYPNINDKKINVRLNDLKEVILNDAKKSNIFGESNIWAIGDDVSTLDLKEWFGKQADPNGFTPPILAFDKTSDIYSLFPRIKDIITGSGMGDKVLAKVFQDTLFADANNAPVISIAPTDTPVLSVDQPDNQNKFQNYDVVLTLTQGSQTIKFDKNAKEFITAYNVRVFDHNLDNAFADTLRNLVSQLMVADKDAPGKTVDRSYLSLVVGEIWTLMGKVNGKELTQAQKVSGDYQFNGLYQLLNLFNSPAGETLTFYPDDLNNVDNEQVQLQTAAQIDMISHFNYSKNNFPKPLENFLRSYSSSEVAKLLNVSGTIHLAGGNGTPWSATLDLNTASTRVLADRQSTSQILLSIYSIQEAIDKAKDEVAKTPDPYRPLLESLVGNNEITEDDYSQINKLVIAEIDNFNSRATPDQIETTDALDLFKHDAQNRIKAAMLGVLTSKGKNISSQMNAAEQRAAASSAALDADPQYISATPDEKSNLDKLRALYYKKAIGEILGTGGLSQSELQSVEQLENQFKNNPSATYFDKFQTATTDLLPSVMISATVGFAADEAAKIAVKKDANDEFKSLATNKIADYLAHANLTDFKQLKDMKEFLDNPFSMQQVSLSKSMKIAVTTLGSFIGAVGVAAAFSTIRSIRTGKNINAIGDDAAVENVKPKKTLAIKSIISASALISAAGLLVLVFTLGGGI